MPTCSVSDCAKPTRSGRADLCAMHYHRQYRHGDVHKVASGIHVGPPRRYVIVSAPGHPMAMKNGRAYAHRVALWDRIGEGPHACHWCGREVQWGLPRGDASCLHVDHLDGRGDNNDAPNLVPACRACNAGRGVQARSDALRARGFWSVNDTVAVATPRLPRIDA